jgi:alpha-L-fucosidase
VGARYVVLVSKHHDGFLMWNSRHPNPRIAGWQAARDIAGELTQAVHSRGMKMGFYYSSLLDWSFTKTPINSLAELVAGSDTSREYLAYIENHWRELIERYDPWLLWSDIGYPPGYELPKLFAEYYNRKPEGVVNDRWMQLPKFFFNKFGRYILTKMIECTKNSELPKPPHCDFVTPEYATLDHVTAHKWETCRGVGNSFGYNQLEDAEDYQKADDLIRLLADIVSKNGNLLLNVGPRADGSLHAFQVEALEGLGDWLRANGEAIYGTRPWVRFNEPELLDGEIRYTSKGAAHYVIVTKRPANGILSLPADGLSGSITLLETGAGLTVERSDGRVRVMLPVGVNIPVLKIQE